jgi:hypothetical protein
MGSPSTLSHKNGLSFVGFIEGILNLLGVLGGSLKVSLFASNGEKSP